MLATDELTWVQGWVPVAKGEQSGRFVAVVAQDRWVLDTVRRVATNQDDDGDGSGGIARMA